MHRLLTIPVVCILLPVLGACAAMVDCPRPVADARAVFLLDHGRHPSLVLEDSDGTLVRYSYGDWRYYALDDTGPGSAVAAMLWRTPAGLGQRRYDVDPTPQSVTRALRVGVQEVHEFAVAGDLADALHERLGEIIANAENRYYQRRFDLEFVDHPRDYWLWYNSNHMVADWLRSLGCDVQGTTMWSNWRTAD